MKPKILIVEDDRGIASFVRRVLEDHEFQADWVTEADKALEYLKSFRPDLMILDINLPGLSGMQLCEILRKDARVADIPILMLSVLGSENERVQGLQTGADDYLVKPFAPKELIARIQAILRRSLRLQGAGRVLSAHGISVDMDKHSVEIDGKPVELRPKEYDLLVAFLRKPGQVLSRQNLADGIWGLDAVVTSHTLSEHIKNLRAKLGDRGSAIETVPDAGYRLKEP